MKRLALFLFVFLLYAVPKDSFSQSTATLVKDIYPGPESGLIHPDFQKLFQGEVKDGILYFSARDKTGQYELWRSDGSLAGTVLHKDLDTRVPGPVRGGVAKSSVPWDFQKVGDDLYFRSIIEPYAGLFRISGSTPEDVTPLWNGFEGDLLPLSFKKVGNKLYFQEMSKTSKRAWGQYLHKIDLGTNKPEVVSKAYYQKYESSRYVYLNDKWYQFALSSGSISQCFVKEVNALDGQELAYYSYDSDPSYTGQRVSAHENSIISSSNRLFWLVEDYDDRSPLYEAPLYSLKLWVSDGTKTNTRSFKRFSFPEVAPSQNAVNLIASMEEKLIFTTFKNTTEGGEFNIWSSDGTESRTQLIGKSSTKSNPFISNIREYNNKIYFMVGSSLWVTDATNSGTKLIKDFNTAGMVKIYENNLYIRDENKLWVSDGTSQGTNVIGELSNFSNDRHAYVVFNPPADFVVSGQNVFYAGFTPETGLELWKLHIPCNYTLKINSPNGTNFCQGSSVQLTAQTSGGSPDQNYTYKWSDNSNGTTLTAQKSGTYLVTASDTKGCSLTSSVTVNELPLPPAPKLTLEGATEFCPGKGMLYVDFKIEPGYTYNWFANGKMIPNTQNADLILISDPGSYQVEVKDSFGCKNNSETLIAKSLPTPSVSISPTGTVSAYLSNSVKLTANADVPAKFQWYRDDKTITGATSAVHETNVDGAYAVYAIGTANGCGAFSTPVEVKFDILTTVSSQEPDGIQIHPNPVTDRVSVNMSLTKQSSLTLRVFNMMGQEIIKIERRDKLKKHQFDLDLSKEGAGVFLFHLENEDTKVARKIIKN